MTQHPQAPAITPSSPFLTYPSPTRTHFTHLHQSTLSIYHLSLLHQCRAFSSSQPAGPKWAPRQFPFFSRTVAWHLGRFWGRSVEGTVVLLYITPPNQCLSNVRHRFFFFTRLANSTILSHSRGFKSSKND